MNNEDHLKVSIAYQDDDEVWDQLFGHLEPLLPLRNVSWDMVESGVKEKKTCTVLEVQFLSHDQFEVAPLPVNKFRWPYVYLYIVNCKESETYTSLKGRIKAWVNSMHEKQREWLLVLVSTGKQSVLTEMAKKLNKTTYDKIKAEFTTTKKEGFDRCFELRIPETGRVDVVSKRAFDDLLTKMKKCIGRTLSQHVNFYKDEVSKLHEMRHTPGWNYCNFFVTKEALAFTYQRARLYDKALQLYKELDDLFNELNRRSKIGDLSAATLPTVETFGGLLGEDSLGILEIDKQQYRNLIHKNSISEFDFRKYLFARRCKLWFAQGKPWEAAAEALPFIHSLGADIGRHKDTLPAHFQESWMFSTCMSVVDSCSEVAKKLEFKKRSGSYKYSALCAALADLCYLARKKLGHLGAAFGLNETDGGKQKEKEVEIPEKMLAGITNGTLKAALRSANDFDNLYLDLCIRAIRYYRDSKRERMECQVNEEMANLHFMRGRFEEAALLLEELTQRYSEGKWYPVLYAAHAKLAQCLQQRGNNAEYLGSCIALLSPNCPLDTSTKDSYQKQILQVARDPATQRVTHDGRSVVTAAFEVLGGVRASAETGTAHEWPYFNLGDTFTIRAKISSSLPGQEMQFDKLQLVLREKADVQAKLGSLRKQSDEDDEFLSDEEDEEEEILQEGGSDEQGVSPVPSPKDPSHVSSPTQGTRKSELSSSVVDSIELDGSELPIDDESLTAEGSPEQNATGGGVGRSAKGEKERAERHVKRDKREQLRVSEGSDKESKGKDKDVSEEDGSNPRTRTGSFRTRKGRIILDTNGATLPGGTAITHLDINQTAIVAGDYVCTKAFLVMGNLRLLVYKYDYFDDNFTDDSEVGIRIGLNVASAKMLLQHGPSLILDQVHTVRLQIVSDRDDLNSATLALVLSSGLSVAVAPGSALRAVLGTAKAQPTKDDATVVLEPNPREKEKGKEKEREKGAEPKKDTQEKQNPLPNESQAIAVAATPTYEMEKVTWEGTVSVTATKDGYIIQLPTMPTHGILDISLPVTAAASNHQLSALLNYVRGSGEHLSASLLSDLQFASPFSCKQIATPVDNRVFIQLSLRTYMPLRFTRYQMQLPSTLAIKTDPNAFLLSQTLKSNQETSMVFEIVQSNPAEVLSIDNRGELLLEYQLEEALPESLKSSKPDQYVHKVPITVPFSNIEYSIEYNYPKSGVVGLPIDIQFTIRRMKTAASTGEAEDAAEEQEGENTEKDKGKEKEKGRDSTENLTLSDPHRSSLRYEVVQGGDWVIVGHTKRFFSLKEGEANTWSLQLFSLTCGFLHLPLVRLDGVAAARVANRDECQQVYICPQPSFTSYCLEEELRE